MEGIVKLTEEIAPGRPDVIVLEVVEGVYSGCKFFYDQCKVEEEVDADGYGKMSFNYQIVNGFKVSDIEDFHLFLGDYLSFILEEMLKKSEVVYSGGID